MTLRALPSLDTIRRALAIDLTSPRLLALLFLLLLTL
jgi:hypothetical protein